MRIKVSEIETKSYKEIDYRLENITGNWFRKGHSHRVTFVASNEIGTARISTLVKAIGKI